MKKVKHPGLMVLLAILIMISGLRFIVYLSWNHAVEKYQEIEDNYRGLAERVKTPKEDRFDVYYKLMALRYVVQELDIDVSLIREMNDYEFDTMFVKK